MQRSKEQNKRMYAIFSRLGLDAEAREEMVYSHTNGRTSHSSQLSFAEAEDLIQKLNEKYPTARPINTKKTAADKAQRMRRKILSIAHEMQWELPNGKVDMERLNAFCIKSTCLHKELNAYTVAELPKLVSEFEVILKKYYRSHA